MRWARLLLSIILATQRRKLSVTDISDLTFRVWVTDVDISIMNHAAMMSVFETGRLDFMVRSGFLKLARRNGWYVPSQNINVQFFRPLKAFQKANLFTEILYADTKWIYVEQQIIREGKPVAICISKNTIKKGKTHIQPKTVSEALGEDDFPREGKALVDLYEKLSEQLVSRSIDEA